MKCLKSNKILNKNLIIAFCFCKDTDWLLATRALLISMNALNLIGGILVIICQIKKKFKGMLAAGGVLGLAGKSLAIFRLSCICMKYSLLTLAQKHIE